MNDPGDPLPDIRAVVARYLDGDEDFDTAADTLARILRQRMLRRPKAAADLVETTRANTLRIKPLSLSEWLHPEAPRGLLVEAGALAPGRSRAEEAKGLALMIEAVRRASRALGGDAA